MWKFGIDFVTRSMFKLEDFVFNVYSIPQKPIKRGLVTNPGAER